MTVRSLIRTAAALCLMLSARGTASAEDGKALYQAQCQLCHGVEGRGDGPAAAALKTAPSNLHDCGRLALVRDADLAKTIREGRGAMPPWQSLGDDAITDLVRHVRSFCDK